MDMPNHNSAWIAELDDRKVARRLSYPPRQNVANHITPQKKVRVSFPAAYLRKKGSRTAQESMPSGRDVFVRCSHY